MVTTFVYACYRDDAKYSFNYHHIIYFKILFEWHKYISYSVAIVVFIFDMCFYINHTQTFCCCYCSMVTTWPLIEVRARSHPRLHQDGSIIHIQQCTRRNTAIFCGDGCLFSNQSNQCNWGGGLCCGDFDIPHVARGSPDPVDVRGLIFFALFFLRGTWSCVCLLFLLFVLIP